MHYFRKGERLFNLERHLDGEILVDLGHTVISEIAAVLREADLLLTDYSSVYIDALYLDKPVVSFAYDLEHYRSQQNGLLYNMDMAFPGPVLGDFDSLLHTLDRELAQGGQVTSERYLMCKQLFFNHLDDGNTRRVLERLRELGAYEE